MISHTSKNRMCEAGLAVLGYSALLSLSLSRRCSLLLWPMARTAPSPSPAVSLVDQVSFDLVSLESCFSLLPYLSANLIWAVLHATLYRTSLLYRQGFIVVSISLDKCTYCKSFWIKAFAKCPKCKCSYVLCMHADMRHNQDTFIIVWMHSSCRPSLKW